MKKNQPRKRQVGMIVMKRGTYYFQNRKGDLFDVSQNKETIEAYQNNRILICDLSANLREGTYFATVNAVVESNGKDPIPEGKAIATAYNIGQEFPREVVQETRAIPKIVTRKDWQGFADLRHIPFVTIDPDSAKDFDDAVFAEQNEDGTYTLRVAIANVASYISKGSALFENAQELGNSSYLGDVCYPMLPEELSNGICSLNEKVDRLVMCTTCRIAPTGEILEYKIEPAVINSNHRLTYKEADYIHFGRNAEGDTKDHSGIIAKTIDVKDSLADLYAVSQILNRARMKRGSFDIDSNVLQFRLDSSKTRVETFEKDHQEEFTSVIEETAVITNEIWGEVAKNLGINFSYRNHKQIDPEKLLALKGKLRPFGIKINNTSSSKSLQSILNFVKGKRIEEYVTSTILKAMESAYYDSTNIGHAGLGILEKDAKANTEALYDVKLQEERLEAARRKYFVENGTVNGLAFSGDISHSAYGHTTSPIRRGADLINQMQMLSVITQGKESFTRAEIADRCIHLNSTERNSASAEKEYNTMLSALWAADNIGKVFRDCTVVDMGKFEADILTPEGFRLKVPYTDHGLSKQYLKIGQRVDSVSIDSVSTYPAKVIGCKGTRVASSYATEYENDYEM